MGLSLLNVIYILAESKKISWGIRALSIPLNLTPFIIFIYLFFHSFDLAHQAYSNVMEYDNERTAYLSKCKKNIAGTWINLGDTNELITIDSTKLIKMKVSDASYKSSFIFKLSQEDCIGSGIVKKFPDVKFELYFSINNEDTKECFCYWLLNCSDTAFSILSREGNTYSYKRSK
jgi:hypothetical protein